MRSVVLLALAGCFTKPAAPLEQSVDASTVVDAATDATPIDAYFPANVVFVTSQKYTAGAMAKPSNANEKCNSLAANAGLTGTYVAWLSTNTSNAITALQGSRGWVRPDGVPFADAPEDLAAGITFAPPRITETREDIAKNNDLVMTGTTSAGISSGVDCVNGGGATVGSPDASAPVWTDTGSTGCLGTVRLYCFGIGLSTPTAPTIPTGGKRAFLSQPHLLGMDVSMLDALCDNDAGSPAGTFRAFVATTTASASTRMQATTGQTWYRLDGTPLYTLDAPLFDAPLDVLADGTHLAASAPDQGRVFFGAGSPTLTASSGSSCSNWNTSGQSMLAGNARRSNGNAFRGSNYLSCDATGRFYCFEK